jgi:hypothetical protein
VKPRDCGEFPLLGVCRENLSKPYHLYHFLVQCALKSLPISFVSSLASFFGRPNRKRGADFGGWLIRLGVLVEEFRLLLFLVTLALSTSSSCLSLGTLSLATRSSSSDLLRRSL